MGGGNVGVWGITMDYSVEIPFSWLCNSVGNCLELVALVGSQLNGAGDQWLNGYSNSQV